MPTDARREELAAVLAGTRRISGAWPGLRAVYAWRPPFEGEAVTQPNRLEVVFSAHSGVELGHDGRVHRVTAPAGSTYVVGPAPTVLRRVPDYSDTLEIYPDLALMRAEAEAAGIAGFELQPTLGAESAVEYRRDPAILGVAHRLPPARTARLDARRLARVAEVVEARLAGTVTLGEMAEEAGLSPFHFARGFKAATGLAPHQYVLARRIELAKRRLLGSRLPVEAVAWEAGFENLSHFRRQFAAQVGVLPGALRRATTGA